MAKLGLILAGIGIFAGAWSAQAAGAGDSGEAQLRKLLKSVAPVCLAAKSPQDLDKLQEKLKAAGGSPARPADPALAAELSGGRMFVSRWRDYLQARKLNGKKAGNKILEELLADRSWLTLVPRSEVLRRYRERPTFFYVRYPTRTVEDFWKAIREFERLEREGESPGMMQHAIEPLKKLKAVWENYSSRAGYQLESACQPESSDTVDGVICKQLMLAHAMPSHLKLDQKYARLPGPEETAARYLTAQIKLARKNRDLVALWRMENYLAFLTKDESPWRTEEIKAIGFCLAGQKSEKDGQIPDALRSYRQALELHASGAVVEFAGARLRDIAQAYPEVYQFGATNLDSRGGTYRMAKDGTLWPRTESELRQRERKRDQAPMRNPASLY